jgi:hypothetical protein
MVDDEVCESAADVDAEAEVGVGRLKDWKIGRLGDW